MSRKAFFLIVGLSGLAGITLFQNRALAVDPAGRCFITGGSAPLRVCHHPQDEGIYYPTPVNEVAYNVQILKISDTKYVTAAHSETMDSFVNKYPRVGDSIKVGTVNGRFTYQMPVNMQFRIWGSLTDTLSPLYYRIGGPHKNYGTSGGANPIMVGGRYWVGDTNIYMFFLGVWDGAKFGSSDWRDYIFESRTSDFLNYEIVNSKNQFGYLTWSSFSMASSDLDKRPATLIDKAGNEIKSSLATTPNGATGMIGSIVIVDKVYYYFYTDPDPTDSKKSNLYVRTALDISGGRGDFWSAPAKITPQPVSPHTLIRVAKAKGMNRWAVFYNCYAADTGRSDICLQYTANLNLVGPGGLSEIQYYQPPKGANDTYHQLFSKFNLGLSLSNARCTASLRAQHYFMTDLNGALASPDLESELSRGGLLTWMDMCLGPYGAPVYRAGWRVDVLRRKPQ
jgi:hypothetical protein